MRAPCLVLVEGVTDKAVVECVARELGVEVDVKILRGNRPVKAWRLANALTRVRKYGKVVVLKDTHRLGEERATELLTKALNGVRHERKYAVLVKESIESWLLAALGVRNPENLSDPVGKLSDLLLRARGVRYVKSPSIVKSVMTRADLRKAVENSETLKRFTNVLRDP